MFLIQDIFQLMEVQKKIMLYVQSMDFMKKKKKKQKRQVKKLKKN